MTRGAQQAQLDFTRLAGEEGGSLFFERFLREGSLAWPEALRLRYPGLACWQGVGRLKASLRALAGSDPALPVLVVNRLARLMHFAARLLFHPCRNVLVTELGWPPYQSILESEARRAGRAVTPVALTPLLSVEGTTDEEVVETVRQRFLQSGCDGLFLTAVSHTGFRLPVERIVRALEAVRELRFVVIDGAQDFCHVSADLSNAYCDLYLAGCHKWLGGFHPMGLGFYGRNRSRGVIETVLNHLVSSGELDDPLLRFTSQLETQALDGVTETVNLVPLFTGQAAASEALEQPLPPAACLKLRYHNLDVAASLAQDRGWQPLLPASPFRTGIALLRAEREKTRRLSAVALREAFASHGVALTAYEHGLVRLSMPATQWQPDNLDRLDRVLQAVA